MLYLIIYLFSQITNITYTAGKVSTEQITNFLGKEISNGTIEDVGNNPSNPHMERNEP